jgi:hypothetical protein
MEKESKPMHESNRKRIQGKMEAGLLVFWILLQKCRNGSLLRLVIVVSIFVAPMLTPW